MERTHKYTITTLDGEEQEIEIHRMTMRHGMKLAGVSRDQAIELLIDMIAPGVLDVIAPESLNGLVQLIAEKEKGFFDQLAKSMPAPAIAKRKTKKSK